VKILVTGGAGFVGSHVVDRLLEEGHAVEVLDNLSTGRRERVHPNARLHVCDLRDARLDEVVATTGPDAVVHVAAQAAVSRSVLDPRFDASVNVLGTIALLEACRSAGVRRVIYISTGGAGYGDTDVLPTPEDHPIRPSSPYGVSKVSAERYVDCWAGLTGGRALTLRLANVFGPRQDPAGEAGVVAIFTSRLLAGDRCLVNGDGEQTRDYIFVLDVADAVARAVVTPDAVGAANIGTGVEKTVNDIYRHLAQLTGVTVPAAHGPAKPGEQRRSVLDASRAKKLLGWSAATPFGEGLRQTVAWFRKELSS
jgi:UDP-glucose 4-epimerase